jgi:hypothetical protein
MPLPGVPEHSNLVLRYGMHVVCNALSQWLLYSLVCQQRAAAWLDDILCALLLCCR